jgi:hypothetical protein
MGIAMRMRGSGVGQLRSWIDLGPGETSLSKEIQTVQQ